MARWRRRMWVFVTIALLAVVAGYWGYRAFTVRCRFHIAAVNGALEDVRYRLERSPSIVNARGSRGSVTLHWAALHGTIEEHPLIVGDFWHEFYSNMLDYQQNHDYLATVQMLLDAGTDPNAVGREGWTPLHLAAAYGSTDVIAALLDAGANLNARDQDGRAPVDWARQFDNATAVEFLTARSDTR